MEEHLSLASSAPAWASCPSHLLIHHSGRGFEIRVDPSSLPPGLHYAEVIATDDTAPWRGPLFRVPITVIKPLTVPVGGPAATAAAAAAPVALLPAAAAAAGEDGGNGGAAAAAARAAASPLHPALARPSSSGAFAAAATAPSDDGRTSASATTALALLAAPPKSAATASAAVSPAPATLALGPFDFAPGSERRLFIAVPPGATWAELVLKSEGELLASDLELQSGALASRHGVVLRYCSACFQATAVALFQLLRRTY